KVRVGDHSLGRRKLADLVGHVEFDFDIVRLADDALAKDGQAFVLISLPVAAVLGAAAAENDRFGFGGEKLADIRRLVETVQTQFNQVTLPAGVEHVGQGQPPRFLRYGNTDHDGISGQTLWMNLSLADRLPGCNGLSQNEGKN